MNIFRPGVFPRSILFLPFLLFSATQAYPDTKDNSLLVNLLMFYDQQKQALLDLERGNPEFFNTQTIELTQSDIKNGTSFNCYGLDCTCGTHYCNDIEKTCNVVESMDYFMRKLRLNVWSVWFDKGNFDRTYEKCVDSSNGKGLTGIDAHKAEGVCLTGRIQGRWPDGETFAIGYQTHPLVLQHTRDTQYVYSMKAGVIDGHFSPDSGNDSQLNNMDMTLHIAHQGDIHRYPISIKGNIAVVNHHSNNETISFFGKSKGTTRLYTHIPEASSLSGIKITQDPSKKWYIKAAKRGLSVVNSITINYIERCSAEPTNQPL